MTDLASDHVTGIEQLVDTGKMPKQIVFAFRPGGRRGPRGIRRPLGSQPAGGADRSRALARDGNSRLPG